MIRSQDDSSTCPGASNLKKEALPLCVDLDGTLIQGDLFWQGILTLLRNAPFSLLLMPFWFLAGGLPNVKRQVADRHVLDTLSLQYDVAVMDFLRSEQKKGRKLILVTGADKYLAEKIAAQIGLFEEVYGTCDGINLKGRRKAELLQTMFGIRGFEYAGDSASDLHVWAVASAAYVVGDEKLVARANSVVEVLNWFPRRASKFTDWVGAARLRHWSKNLLMLTPLLLAHRLSFQTLLPTSWGVLLFGMCSSGSYIINDLLDLESDRDHPWNCRRPFASGQLSIPSGLVAAGSLIAFSLLAGAFTLNKSFVLAVALYLLTTILYSIKLKKISIVDVFVLSSFYTYRIWAGALITGVPLSQWFMAFSLFFFLSLAIAKRYSELVHAAEQANAGRSGRNYRTDDRAILMNIGLASCFSAIVILSLYVHSAEVLILYPKPGILLLTCPLILYWTCRIWLKAHRGELNDDPVSVAMSDPVSYVLASAVLIVIVLSSWKV